MKTTYLIYKQVNGVEQLVVATQAEWDAIMKENRGLPEERRRCFMMDCIDDEDELDCMFIEVSASEHRKWNSENTVYQRKRKAGKRYNHQSLDTGASGHDYTMKKYLSDCLPHQKRYDNRDNGESLNAPSKKEVARVS